MSTPSSPARPRTTLYLVASVYSPADPFATAVLVEGDRVAWVGSAEAAQAQRGRADVVVEAPEALVTPAFVDAHVHVTETGMALRGLDLSGARSLARALDLVADAARRSPGERVLGHGWDESTWPEQRAPSREQLDRAGGGAQVYLSRVDVHSAVVSSALAQAAGAAALPGWDPGGRVERDAHHATRALTRDVGAAERTALQRAALAAAAAAGIGSVHECAAPHVGSPEDLRSLRALSDGGLPDAGPADGAPAVPEVLAYWGALAGDEQDARRILEEVAGTGVLGLAGDLCVDGSLGSRTAALREPYADLPGTGLPADHTGHRYLDAEQVAAHVVACTRVGVQAGFHVIGDAACDALVGGLLRAERVLGTPAVASGRHRVEHLESPDARAVAELARLGVVASVQPVFDALWGGQDGMYAERLGRTRALALGPLADLAAAGVPLALGSDAPVTPFDPWAAVRASALHSVPEQRLSARAAFLASTRGGWRAARRDGEGVLAPGSQATLAVWSVEDLVVQAPDRRVSSWSTDPRSGTPGLPDLLPGAPDPTCLRTLRAGVVLHDSGVLGA